MLQEIIPMKYSVILCILWLLLPLALLRAAVPSKPNIVYLLADDLGYGDVQCLNLERGKIATPNIDRLANEGMVFTDAHSGSSVCTPTRYGILTGRYAWRTRLQSGVLKGYETPLIASERLTVPSLLQQQGFHTACIGKWHLGFTIEGADRFGGGKPGDGGAPLGAITHNGPTTRGFDEYYGFHHARMMKSFFENKRVTQRVEEEDMLPLLAKESVAFVKRQTETEQPFFLYLALSAPHTPIVPTKDWQGKSELGKYGDFVMETDWAVGEVLKAIDQAGVAENTLVIFTSDNGCSKAAGISKLQTHGHYPSADLRGSKADLFDGGHRIPFVVRWPGKVDAGSSSEQTICLTDLMATCAEFLETELPANAAEDSVSILPALLSTDRSPLRDSIVHHSINGSFAIRQGDWKLSLCPGSGGWSSPKPGSAEAADLPAIQLYNLANDLGETNNLQAKYPESVAQLTELLEEQIADGRSTPGPQQTNDADIRLYKASTKPISN